MTSGPTSFLQAVKKAKEVEQAYKLGDNRPPLDGLNGRIEDQVVRAVRQEMNHFKTSNRDRDAWGERRPDPRSEARAPPREPARANERPRGRSPERNPPVNQPAARPPPPPASEKSCAPGHKLRPYIRHVFISRPVPLPCLSICRALLPDV
jgi:hypothetical protein